MGVQTVDLQPGIQPNGLFWTTQIARRDFWSGQRRSGLNLKDQALVETFVFAGPNAVPALASMNLRWQRTSPEHARGSGAAAQPTDPDAFEGSFADAVCTGSLSGERLGFRFEMTNLTSEAYYASVGTEQNGAWLT